MLLTLEESISIQHFQFYQWNASIVSNKKAERRFKGQSGKILMEQHVFCILIDYRGRHRKGVAIYNAT
jgi:hypothetical protein